MDPENDNTPGEAVAEACEAAIALAAMAGMDVVTGSPSILLSFPPNGDITVSLMVDGEMGDSGIVSAEDIAKYLSADEAEESADPVILQ